MTILSLNSDHDYLYYAIFVNFFKKNGFILKKYGKIKLDTIKRTYEFVDNLVKSEEIAFCVMQYIDLEKGKRKECLLATKERTIIKLVCEQSGVVYSTPSTFGWDRYFYGDKIQKPKLKQEKLKIANEIFGIQTNDEIMADTIMLGWTMALNKLKVHKKGEYEIWF